MSISSSSIRSGRLWDVAVDPTQAPVRSLHLVLSSMRVRARVGRSCGRDVGRGKGWRLDNIKICELRRGQEAWRYGKVLRTFNRQFGDLSAIAATFWVYFLLHIQLNEEHTQ